MAVNDKQKIVLIDINANTQTLIEAKLAEGYVILFMLSMLPTYTKILIVYATPPTI